MFPILHVGPLALQAPGLILIVGIWVSLLAIERYARRFKANPNLLYNLVLIGLVAGVLGARFGYAIQYSAVFLAAPLNLFSLTPTMLNPLAGIMVGTLAAGIYGQRRAMPLWPTLDALTPGLSLFMIALHLANLASGDAFGTPAEIPWAVNLWGEARHPVQLYELVAALLIAGLLLPRKNSPEISGAYFWTFVALTALARLFFEYFRGDAITLFWNIRIAQCVAWFVLAIALQQLGHRIKPSQ
jgi:prolipoprotein diacylglyceryltransferase